MDSGGGSGQFVVVKDAEEGVIGQQSQSHLAQQPFTVRLAIVQIVGDPPEEHA